MTYPTRVLVGTVLGLLLAQGVVPARADLQLCNRTSYVLDLALGLATKAATATRGWFRVDPGRCRTVLQGAIEADQVYVHARPHAVYHEPPLPLAKHAELCVADESFVIAGARQCPPSGQRLAAFTEVKPSEAETGHVAHIAEAAEYAPEQARLAAIQRLLIAVGYDAEPIDGIEGARPRQLWRRSCATAAFLRPRRKPRIFSTFCSKPQSMGMQPRSRGAMTHATR